MNYKYLSLAILAMVAIFFLSSLPQGFLLGKPSLSVQIITNLAHIPAYSLLTFLWLRSFNRGRNGNQSVIIKAIVVIGAIVFAISDEIHQSFVPGRSVSCLDIALDLLGIFLGLQLLKIKALKQTSISY